MLYKEAMVIKLSLLFIIRPTNGRTKKTSDMSQNKDLNQPVQLRSLISQMCLNEETLHHWLSKMCPVKILIWLSECTCWSHMSEGMFSGSDGKISYSWHLTHIVYNTLYILITINVVTTFDRNLVGFPFFFQSVFLFCFVNCVNVLVVCQDMMTILWFKPPMIFYWRKAVLIPCSEFVRVFGVSPY